MNPWCRLMPQAIMALNMLRPCRKKPTILAHTAIKGQFDCNKTPLETPGIKVLVQKNCNSVKLGEYIWSTRMVHRNGNGALWVLHMPQTKHQGGKTCGCGGIFVTTPCHARIINNKAIHQGSQGTDTNSEKSRTKQILQNRRETITHHQYIGNIIQQHATR